MEDSTNGITQPLLINDIYLLAFFRIFWRFLLKVIRITLRTCQNRSGENKQILQKIQNTSNYIKLPKVFQMRVKMASEALKCSINVSFSGCGFLGKFNLCFLTIKYLQILCQKTNIMYTTKSEQNLQDSLQYKITHQ